MRIRPLVKYHGGKYYLSQWIISHFPEYYELMGYCEVFGGMFNTLLQKKQSVSEIIADINPDIHNLITIVKAFPDRFQKELSKLEYSKETFEKYKTEKFKSRVGRAIQQYVIRRMSRGGMCKTFAWQNRTRGGKPGSINEWETSLKNIIRVSNRIQYVWIQLESFQQSLKNYDTPNTLFYLDPTYLHSTRTAKKVYNYEMDEQAHIDLLDILNKIKGKALVSGYASDLYNKKLKNWNRYEKNVVNHSGQNKRKNPRTEILWTNY